MKSVWNVALTAAVLALGAIPACAQPVISAKSGLVAYVQGEVFLGDQPVESSLTSFPEVKEKMVLRTAEGRAEVLLSPGVFLRMGENSSFRMIANRLIDTRLELLLEIKRMKFQCFDVEEHGEISAANRAGTGPRKHAKRRKYRKEQDLG